MSWLIKQQEDENMEAYMSYLITKELEGKKCPSFNSVVNLINSKRRTKNENRKV